jgi:hypothetical protein
MNRGTALSETNGSPRLHAVAHLVAPAPGIGAEWFTLCAGDSAAAVDGSFDPDEDHVCPACREFLLDAAA